MKSPEIVLLINPSAPSIFPPPSLGYLKSFIESQRSDYKVILADVDDPQCLPKLSSVKIVGISVHSFAIPVVVYLIPFIKRAYPSARLVAGGHHATARPQSMLSLGFDQVVLGPGENALLDILDGVHTPLVRGSLPQCLDDLPFPDYSGLGGKWTLPLNQGGRALPMISSRGCPFSCRFCASADFWHRKWFPRSPDNVLKEILWRLETSQMDSFMFEDDNFTLDRIRAMAICKGLEIIRKQYPTLQWQAASRAESLVDDELCASLKRAGATHLWLGIETGSPKILKDCGKTTTVEKMLQGIKIAEKNGLRTFGQFIVGLIGETRETIEETRDFIRQSDLTYIGVNKAWVLPHTYLYDVACKAGFSDEEYLEGVPFFTWEHPSDLLDYWVDLLKAVGPAFSPEERFWGLNFCRRRWHSLLRRLWRHLSGNRVIR